MDNKLDLKNFLQGYWNVCKNARDLEEKSKSTDERLSEINSKSEDLRIKLAEARSTEERRKISAQLKDFQKQTEELETNREGIDKEAEQNKERLKGLEQGKENIRMNAEKYYNEEKTRLENLIKKLEGVKVPDSSIQNAIDQVKKDLNTLEAHMAILKTGMDKFDKLNENDILNRSILIEEKELGETKESADVYLYLKDADEYLKEAEDAIFQDYMSRLNKRYDKYNKKDKQEQGPDNSEEQNNPGEPDSSEEQNNPGEPDSSEEQNSPGEPDSSNGQNNPDFQPPVPQNGNGLVIDEDHPDGWYPPTVADNEKMPPAVADNEKMPPAVAETQPTVDKNKLPVRTFWEIYNDTHKNHCGTFRRTIYQMAHAPIFSAFGRDKDTVDRVLSVAIDAVTWPVKLVAKATNGILKTDRLYQAEHDAISRLSPEEFDILVSDSAEANMLNGRMVKLPTDRHFLEPNLMKQAKVNDMYLDVVGQVLNERQSQQLNGFDVQDQNGNLVHRPGIEEMIVANEQRIRELSQRRQNGSITPQEEAELGNLGISNSQLKAAAKAIADKAIGFREGAKLKTGSFKNISGWVLAKNNPDNREFIEQMAGLSAQLREATIAGDAARVADLDTQMDDVMRQNTRIRQIGFNRNNLLDRGNASLIRHGEFLDKGAQDKTRKLLTTVALGAVVGRALYTWAVNKGIVAHNSEIEAANQYNGDIKYSGKKDFADQKDIEEAATDYASTKVVGAHSSGEYSNLDESAMEVNGKWADGLNTPNYTARDEALHANTNQTMAQIQATSDPVQKAVIGSKYYSGVQSHTQSIAQQYAETHSQFDYSGFEQALAGPSTGDAMIKLLTDIGDGSISYSGSVAGIQVGTMGTISYIPDVFAGLAVGRTVLNAAAQNAEDRAQQSLQRQIDKNRARAIKRAARQASKNQGNDRNQDDDSNER